MMKKMLALILVLCISGVAGAAYEITGPEYLVDWGSDFTITVSGTAADVGAGLSLGIYSDDIVTDNGVSNAYMGNLGSLVHYVAGGFDGWEIVIGDVQGPGVEDGDWVILTFTAPDLDPGEVSRFLNFDVYDYNVGYGVLSSFEVYIPEPMTIGLLGLGGLFLRRRKK